MEKSSEFGISPQILEYGIGYRVLRKLEAHELVKSRWDTGGDSGMPRRVYTITQDGLEFLKRWYDDIENAINSLMLLRDRIESIIRER